MAQLRRIMRACEQTKGQSVLAHGISVAKHYRELYRRVHHPEYEMAGMWRLPEWLDDPRLKAALLPLAPTLRYQIYHDCGKPWCVYEDEGGRRHFPDHVEHSWRIWTALNPDDEVAWLIRHDMDVHLAKAVDAPVIASTPYWATQLLTGLAELHANAGMFGGIESTSFKIKYKALNKTAKRVLKQK
jgi:hypothetical protein